MRARLLLISALLVSINAELSLPLTDMPNKLTVPSGIQSLFDSVESRASAAASEIDSIVSHAATAVPSQILSKALDTLPAETSTSVSGATTRIAHRSWLADGAIGAFLGLYWMD